MSASSTALPNACWPWTTMRMRYVSPCCFSSLPASTGNPSSVSRWMRVKPAHDDSDDSKVSRRILAACLAGRARALDVDDLLVGEAEHLSQDLVGVLAEQRRAVHLADAVRELDRVADAQIFAARGMIDLDHGAAPAQR